MSQPFLYSVERVYASPVEKVWDAWIDARALEAWYHPTDLKVLSGSVISQPQVAGIWAVGVEVPKFNFVAYFFGRYKVVEKHKRLEHTMSYTQSVEEFVARNEDAPSHNVVIEFEARDATTWVKFSQFGELPEGQAAQAQTGMESYFDSLEIFLNP